MTSTCRKSFHWSDGRSTSCPSASTLAIRTQTQKMRKMNVWTMKSLSCRESSERFSVSRNQRWSQNQNQRRREKSESQKRMLVSQDQFQILVWKEDGPTPRARLLALLQSGFEGMRLNRLRLLPENSYFSLGSEQAYNTVHLYINWRWQYEKFLAYFL